MRFSMATRARHYSQYFSRYFIISGHREFKMAAGKPEVLSTLVFQLTGTQNARHSLKCRSLWLVQGQISASNHTPYLVIQYGRHETGSSNISRCIIDRKAVSKGNTMFSWIASTMDGFLISLFAFCYAKFNMAAAKPEVVITYVLLQIVRWFQKLKVCFQGSPTQWMNARYQILLADMKNPMWRLQTRKWLQQMFCNMYKDSFKWLCHLDLI